MLETVEKYSDENNFDEILPKEKVSEETIQNDFEFIVNSVSYENTFSESIHGIHTSEIICIYSDDMNDAYAQEVKIEYELFIRTVKIGVSYAFENYDWQMTYEILEDDVMLSDNINGCWEKILESTHPMLSDSVLIINIAKLDVYTAKYDCLKTSSTEGGNDISFSESRAINILYEDSSNYSVKKIILTTENAYGSVVILPEGLMFQRATPGTGDPYIKLEKK